MFHEDSAIHYQFLGGMLGKVGGKVRGCVTPECEVCSFPFQALYEGQLVELPFAGFFLCKLTDRGRGIVGAHHLASLDPELYR